MIRHRRTAGLLAAALCLGAASVFGAGPASADDADQRFSEAIDKLGIPLAPDADAPAIGHHICDMMKTGLQQNVNPVPTVRGVVTTLQNSGVERGQAVGLMQAAVILYCPEYSNVMGR